MAKMVSRGEIWHLFPLGDLVVKLVFLLRPRPSANRLGDHLLRPSLLTAAEIAAREFVGATVGCSYQTLGMPINLELRYLCITSRRKSDLQPFLVAL